MKPFLFVMLAALYIQVPFACAQQYMTAHTLASIEGASSTQTTIEDMAWLAGAWKGEGLGGVSEEIWSAPDNGAMMGVYRLMKGEETIFYEMLTLIEEPEGMILRLKHFDASLVGWEEKDQTVEFDFLKEADGKFYFEGLTFHPQSDTTLTIYVAIEQDEGAVREEVVRLRRER